MSTIDAPNDQSLRDAIFSDYNIIRNFSYLGFDAYTYVRSDAVSFLLRVYDFLIDINRQYPTQPQVSEDISLDMSQISWIKNFLQDKVRKKTEAKFASVFQPPECK